MTPKEKAKKIYEKFHNHTIDDWTKKQCALICVDEIVSNVLKIISPTPYLHEYISYWQEVKQEIEKL